MERVSHHGRETAYRVRGDGAPILCVHGSGGTGAVWRAQLGRLARERRVVALDLSGHGGSGDVAASSGQPALEAYADDVIAVARATGTQVLCGHSLGGAVAIHVALDRRFDPAALVLAGTGAKLPIRADLLAWLADDFERAVEFLHGPDRLFHDPGPYRSASEAAMRAVGPAVTQRDFETCDAFDVRDQLTDVRAPALAITGEHDELTPPWYHGYLAEHLPRARSVIIPEAAHLSLLERPEAFNAAVSGFLAEVGV